MKGNPLISVAMGVCYKDFDTILLVRAIQSILAQNLGDFEFLICEYASSEPAKRKLEEFSRKDRRIRLIHGSAPGTLSQNLNLCLRVARGKFLARMDDDDFSHPDRFEQQASFLSHHPDLSFVGCNVRVICAGKIVGQRCFPEFPTVREFLMTQPYIHPTIMFRREVLEVVGGYSERPSCTLCEDYDLLLRLYAKGFRGANIQAPLLDYTIPESTKGKRTMIHRWYETVTRYQRFHELNLLPAAFPYVVKPLLVGLLPACILSKIKNDGERTDAIISPRKKDTSGGQ